MKKFFFYILLLVCTIQFSSNAFHAKKSGKKDSYGESIARLVDKSQDTKSKIIKKYCTNAKSISTVFGVEEAKIYKVKNYHINDEKLKKIDLKKLGKTSKDRQLSAVLKDLYCLKKNDIKTILNQAAIDSKRTIDDELIKSQSVLKVPKEIILRVSDLEEQGVLLAETKTDKSIGRTDATDIIGPIQDKGRVGQDPKPAEPVVKFDAEKRDKLLTAAENKKNEFDGEITKLKGLKDEVNTKYEQLKINFNTSLNSVEDTLKFTKNFQNLVIREKFNELEDLKKEHFDGNKLAIIKGKIGEVEKNINDLVKSENYVSIKNLIKKLEQAEKKKNHKLIKKQSVEKINKRQLIDATGLDDRISGIKVTVVEFDLIIESTINPLREEIDRLELGEEGSIDWKFIAIIAAIVLVIGIIVYIFIAQNRKIKKLSKMSQSTESKFSDIEGKIRSTSARAEATRGRGRGQPKEEQPSQPAPKSPQDIIKEKYDDLARDYREALDNFPKIAEFKQKWNGLALSRKDRQEGSKTVLVNSARAFEKSEIWCANFDDKFFAFPGASVKNNMATYMNLDFEKAHRDFKGVFNVSTGSSYTTEPCLIRRGGAGFIVEKAGKIQFPR